MSTRSVPAVASLPSTTTEAQLQDLIIHYARLCGWKVAHFRPAKTEKGWRTPMQGDVGFPDLVLARDGEVLLVELKNNRTGLTTDQMEWIEASDGLLWRPSHWPQIVGVLT